MLRRTSQAVAKTAARAAATQCQAARGVFRVQRAGFASIYDLQTPYEDTVRHRSDAELRIAKVPVVEVEGSVAVCDGGGGALGHPLEYIQLDTVSHHSAQTCKYCGVQYKMKEGYHGGH